MGAFISAMWGGLKANYTGILIVVAMVAISVMMKSCAGYIADSRAEERRVAEERAELVQLREEKAALVEMVRELADENAANKKEYESSIEHQKVKEEVKGVAKEAVAKVKDKVVVAKGQLQVKVAEAQAARGTSAEVAAREALFQYAIFALNDMYTEVEG